MFTKKDIIDLIDRNDRAVLRGVLAIDDRQTSAERATGETRENNGIGWNSFDARIMGSFAGFIRHRGFLTEKQIVMARKTVRKYAGQLADIANDRAAEAGRPNPLPQADENGRTEILD